LADSTHPTPVQGLEQLHGIVNEIIRQSPSTPFNLGKVVVDVWAPAPEVPLAATTEQSEVRERNDRVVPDALSALPGVSIQRIGPRNERGIFIRGFDVRQIPLYIDGIPVYVPYDGYVDLDRFLVYDVAEAQVTKGFTSPLYGPNAIGGAINLISQEPTKKLNLDLGSGYASGQQFHSFINAGTRWEKFWLQGGFEWLDSDSFPLSGNFQTNALQPDHSRENSYQTDYKGRFKIAWTPNNRDQYTFSYANQQGEKGNPPYAGTDPAVSPRFWRWPDWDKESFTSSGTSFLLTPPICGRASITTSSTTFFAPSTTPPIRLRIWDGRLTAHLMTIPTEPCWS
jgi:iron complex outermembrane receptor protein